MLALKKLVLSISKKKVIISGKSLQNLQKQVNKNLRIEKKNDYRQKLEWCKTNTSETWTILNTIIGKRKSEAKYSN